MAERDWTLIFEKFRRSYRSTVVPIVPRKAIFENEIYTSLTCYDPNTIELHGLKPPVSPAERRWLARHQELGSFLLDLESAIERLKGEHERARLVIDWEAGGNYRDQRISDNKTSQLFRQIMGMFAVAQGKIDELTATELGLIEPDWRLIKENRRIAFRNYLARLVERLCQVEEEVGTKRLEQALKGHTRARGRMWRNSPMKTPTTSPTRQDSGDQTWRNGPIKTPTTSPTRQELGNQMCLVLIEAEQDEQNRQNTILIDPQERDQAVEMIALEMAQVVDLLYRIQTMVLNQGDVLDRIDYNLEQSRRYIRRGNDQLIRSKKGSISTTRKLVLLFLLLLAFVLFIAVLVKPRG